METINIYQAKTQLSKLVDRVEKGEEIVIARNGRPVVRITQLRPEKRPIVFGLLEGEAIVPEDFDDPLPDDVLAAFEGR